MNSRLQSLIDRGYSEEEVLSLASYTTEDMNYACNNAFRHISRNCKPVTNPCSVFIGGQPGSGKSILSFEIKEHEKNALQIGIDNYRMYHPNYLEIEKCINRHWKNRKETINDSPGNDIADFTHAFAGAMTDKLIEMGSNNSYNLILEWGMRTPEVPLKTMSDLKNKGYKNTVIFVAIHKDISYEACLIRTNSYNGNHIMRKVPKSFHDLSVATLPDSINTIYKEGFANNVITDLVILNRKNEIVWSTKSSKLPGLVYNEFLNNPIYSKGIENSEILPKKTTEEELKGLYSLRNELQSVYIVNPNLEALSSKTK